MAARFVPNANIVSRLAASPQVGAALLQVAQLAAAAARDVAPVGDAATDPHPGQFRDSIEAVPAVELGMQAARVQTTDPDGPYIEFGTSKSPPHPTLRRGAEAIGLNVR